MPTTETLAESTRRIDGNSRWWDRSYTAAQAAYDPNARRYAHVSDILFDTVKAFPDRVGFSLVLPGGQCLDKTYAEIGQAADAVAAYLREDLGLQPGDVVAVQLPNSLHYPVVLFGALRAGLTVTNLNPLYTPREIAHQLRDSGAKVLFGFNLFADRLSKALEDVPVDRVIVAAVWDFFPQEVSSQLEHYLRNVAKQVPDVPFDHENFADALEKGGRHRGKDCLAEGKDCSAPAFIQYTGGTTGASKGAELTHDNVAHVLEMLECSVRDALDPDRQNSILTVIPYYHIFALIVNMMLFTSQGGRNILIPNPNPVSNLKPAFENYPIDWLTGVDTLFNGLMAQDWFQEMKPEIELTIGGGTALKEDTASRWQAAVGPIAEGYGMTESTCIIAISPFDGRGKPGTVGFIVPGLDAKITDDQGNPMGIGEPGELHVRGPNIATGYRNQPEAGGETFQDGWMATGDVVTMDADGYVTIVDRKKDMILVSGFNVYPNELEAVIQALPQVDEVAVVGKPHSERGESPHAFIKRNNDGLTEKMVVDHCRANLTGYKIPTHVTFLSELPKSPVGKILRKDL
ncbi:AMP-binding protein [Leisingera sp. MMG026]|uniref:AMP-binding protein n=1 Tax=Leisingera sp. MMG026 TaxID=2909982 RepID=UPI001F3D9CAF|nr:AMP-binding protein [Leisingera sp. MMG026]MCF6433537.1 AMP-binding protein [Leisingera sp. MMG026]